MSGWSQVVIPLAAGLGGVALGQWGAIWLASKNDKRRLRDAKRERLGRLYAPLVDYALFLEKAFAKQGFTYEGETASQRDEHLAQREAELRPDVLRAQQLLHVEPDTQAVVDAFVTFMRLQGEYGRLLALPAHGGQFTVEQVQDKCEEFHRAASELQTTARRQLENLETPL